MTRVFLHLVDEQANAMQEPLELPAACAAVQVGDLVTYGPVKARIVARSWDVYETSPDCVLIGREEA